MNWDQVEGKWKQFKGSARQKWGQLTDDDLQQISGNREKLIGRLQERYGILKEEASKQADEWVKYLKLDASTRRRSTKSISIAIAKWSGNGKANAPHYVRPGRPQAAPRPKTSPQ